MTTASTPAELCAIVLSWVPLRCSLITRISRSLLVQYVLCLLLFRNDQHAVGRILSFLVKTGCSRPTSKHIAPYILISCTHASCSRECPGGEGLLKALPTPSTYIHVLSCRRRCRKYLFCLLSLKTSNTYAVFSKPYGRQRNLPSDPSHTLRITKQNNKMFSQVWHS